MVALPPFLPTAGLCTSPGAGTPKHCIDALNVFSHKGRILKRSGMVSTGIVSAVTDAMDIVGVSWSIGTMSGGGGAPGALTGFGAAASGYNQLWIGMPSNRIDHVRITGKNASPPTWAKVITKDSMTLWAWNGSAYAQITEWDFIHKPASIPKSPVGGDVVLVQRGLFGASTGHNNTADTTHCQDTFTWAITFRPPADWDHSVIGGQDAWWLIFEFSADTPLYPGAAPNLPAETTTNGIDIWQSTAANALSGYKGSMLGRIMTWRDRRGHRHEVCASVPINLSTGVPLSGIQVYVDRTLWTVPTTVVGSGKVSSWGRNPGDFRTLGCYSPNTDKAYLVLGDNGWVSISIASGGNTVQPFIPTAASDLADTPYLNYPGLFRGSIEPNPTSVVMHDGRIFYAVGQKLVWSAPGVWVDIWPAGNEMDLADGTGNITSLLSFGGVLYAFKAHSIYAITPQGSDPEGYQSQIVIAGKGSLGPDCACAAGSLVAFLGDDGVYAFDGSSVSKLTGAVNEMFGQGQTECSDWSSSTVLFHPGFNQVRVYYRSRGEARYLDKGLYINVSAILGQRADAESEPQVSCWPQGPYDPIALNEVSNLESFVYGVAPADHGFRMLNVYADQASEDTEVIAGIPGGWIARLDVGDGEGWSVVKSRFRSMPMGVGGAAMTMLRWITTTMTNLGNRAWKLWAVFDENTDTETEYSVSSYKDATSSELFQASDVFSNSTTFSPSKTVVTREVPFSRRARMVSMGAKHEVAGPAEWIALQAELNPLGRRGEK